MSRAEIIARAPPLPLSVLLGPGLTAPSGSRPVATLVTDTRHDTPVVISSATDFRRTPHCDPRRAWLHFEQHQERVRRKPLARNP